VSGILAAAAAAIFVIADPFKGLLYSQMLLSVQLPFTVFLQIYLTSSGKVMGQYKNSLLDKGLLGLTGITVLVLNLMLLKSFF